MSDTILKPVVLALQPKQSQNQSVNIFENVEHVFIDLESVIKASDSKSYQDFDVTDFFNNIDYCKDSGLGFLFLKNSELLNHTAVKRIQMNLMTNGYLIQTEPLFFNSQECFLYTTL
jgi:hypothetical protein